MNETGLSLVSPRRLHRDETVCSSSDNEVAGAVLQNWFFVQDFWPMGHSGSLIISLFFSLSVSPVFVFDRTEQPRVHTLSFKGTLAYFIKTTKKTMCIVIV